MSPDFIVVSVLLLMLYVAVVIGLVAIVRESRKIREQRVIDIRRSVLAEIRTYCEHNQTVRLSDILRIIDREHSIPIRSEVA